jgi:hypothetical protein
MIIDRQHNDLTSLGGISTFDDRLPSVLFRALFTSGASDSGKLLDVSGLGLSIESTLSKTGICEELIAQ